MFLDPSTGEKTCDCDDKFSGDVCDVECGGNGKYETATGGCVCHKGWTGFNCDARCDGTFILIPVQAISVTTSCFLLLRVRRGVWDVFAH